MSIKSFFRPHITQKSLKIFTFLVQKSFFQISLSKFYKIGQIGGL